MIWGMGVEELSWRLHRIEKVAGGSLEAEMRVPLESENNISLHTECQLDVIRIDMRARRWLVKLRSAEVLGQMWWEGITRRTLMLPESFCDIVLVK